MAQELEIQLAEERREIRCDNNLLEWTNSLERITKWGEHFQQFSLQKKDDFSWKKLLRQMRKVFFKKLQSRRGLVKKRPLKKTGWRPYSFVIATPRRTRRPATRDRIWSQDENGTAKNNPASAATNRLLMSGPKSLKISKMCTTLEMRGKKAKMHLESRVSW